MAECRDDTRLSILRFGTSPAAQALHHIALATGRLVDVVTGADTAGIKSECLAALDEALVVLSDSNPAALPLIARWLAYGCFRDYHLALDSWLLHHPDDDPCYPTLRCVSEVVQDLAEGIFSEQDETDGLYAYGLLTRKERNWRTAHAGSRPHPLTAAEFREHVQRYRGIVTSLPRS